MEDMGKIIRYDGNIVNIVNIESIENFGNVRNSGRYALNGGGRIYVYGNTAEEYEPEIYPAELPDRKKDNKKETSVRTRSRENAESMNFVCAIFLALAATATLVLCIIFLGVQSEISEKTAYISNLKSNIATLRTNNDAMNYSVNSYIDFDNIYKVATEELGMIHATKKQVKIYDGREPEYMKQMGDIPDR